MLSAKPRRPGHNECRRRHQPRRPMRMAVCSIRDFEPRYRTSPKNSDCARRGRRAKIFDWPRLSQRRLAPMTVSTPNVTEIKLDRLIDDMRVLRSQMIAFDRQLKGIEAYLKPSEQQPKSESRLLFAAAARAMARTVLILFAVTAATGAVLHYLGT